MAALEERLAAAEARIETHQRQTVAVNTAVMAGLEAEGAVLPGFYERVLYAADMTYKSGDEERDGDA